MQGRHNSAKSSCIEYIQVLVAGTFLAFLDIFYHTTAYKSVYGLSARNPYSFAQTELRSFCGTVLPILSSCLVLPFIHLFLSQIEEKPNM